MSFIHVRFHNEIALLFFSFLSYRWRGTGVIRVKQNVCLYLQKNIISWKKNRLKINNQYIPTKTIEIIDSIKELQKNERDFMSYIS